MPAVPKSQNTQEPTLDPFHAREPATLASNAGGFPLAPQVAGQSAYRGSGEAYKGEGKRMDLEKSTSKRKASAKDNGMMISSVALPNSNTF